MDGGPPQHHSDLAAVRATAWDMLVTAASSREHAMRQCSIATVARDGRPTVRTVILRAADPSLWTIRFYTDTRSNKVAELRHDPRAQMHFYDHDAKIQIRARGAVVLHNADDVTAALWAAMREESKACYRQPIGPGVPIDAPDGAEGPLLGEHAGYRHFVVAVLDVEALEWVHLAAGGHRRATLTPATAEWLAP